MKLQYLRDEFGFSLLELMIATLVIGILSITVSGFYVNRLIDASRTFTQTSLQSNTKQAVDIIVRDIKSAQTVETSNRWPDANAPSAPADPYSWLSTVSNPSTLVLATPAVDASGNLLYVDLLHNVLQTNDVIYFVEPAGKILYRRIVANPASGNVAKTTCPPALATPSCPVDAKVVEDVANLKVSYLDSNGASTTNPDLAGSVVFTLQQSRVKFGATYKSVLTSQATMRNK